MKPLFSLLAAALVSAIGAGCVSDVDIDVHPYVCARDADCAGLLCLPSPNDPQVAICQRGTLFSRDCDPGCPVGSSCDAASGLCVRQVSDPETQCDWFRSGPDAAAEMCEIPADIYPMGCNANAAECPEKSQPEVRSRLTRNVYIDRFEVTNARYRAFLQANPTAPLPLCTRGEKNFWNSNRALLDNNLTNHPVVCVSAREAEAFCAWAGKELPREAEWEAAARGAEASTDPYPWGALFDTTRAQCFREEILKPESQCQNTYERETCEGTALTCPTTAPITLADGASSQPDGRAWRGAEHMSGNVAEWVSDGWSENHKGWPVSGNEDIVTPPSDVRIAKGGSFESTADQITVWSRSQQLAGDALPSIGFRCALRGP